MVKVTHIWSVNILTMVIYLVKITTVLKYQVLCDILCKNYYCHQNASHVWDFDLHIYNLSHFKGQHQSLAHFDREYLEMVRDVLKITNAIK